MNKILSNMKIQLKNSFARDIFKFILFIHPIIHSLIMYMIYKQVDNEVYLEYAFLGTGFLSFWTVILFSSASDIEREKNEGTLPLLFMSPMNFFLLIFSKLIGNSILGILPIGISMATMFMLRPIYFKVNIFLFIVNLILGILVLTVFSTVFSFLFTLSRNTRLLMNNLEYPLYIISGVMFPIEILPSWLQIVAKSFPLYWININIRNIFFNRFSFKEPLILTCFLVIYIILIKVLYSFLINKIKIKGSIEVM